MTKKVPKSKLDIWHVEKKRLSSLYLSDHKKYDKIRIERNCIYMAELGQNLGRELTKVRPVLVISTDDFNSKSQPTALVIPITEDMVRDFRNPDKPRYQSHYFLLHSKYSFLEQDSSLQLEQIRCLSKIRFKRFMGRITEEDSDNINNKLKYFISLN